MKFIAVCSAGLLLVGASAVATASAAQAADNAIQIVSATYGYADSSRPLVFTDRLQAECGSSVSMCETFCTRAAVGQRYSGFRLPFSDRPICRVVYRCGSQATRAVDADDNDTIYLTCRRLEHATPAP